MRVFLLILIAAGCSDDKQVDSANDTAVVEVDDSGSTDSGDPPPPDRDAPPIESEPSVPGNPLDLQPEWVKYSIFVDADGDGVSEDMDCDDEDPGTYPEAIEYCDGVDNDCDRTIDGATAVDRSLWYFDGDGDGYGVGGPNLACWSPGDQWVLVPGDCDDSDERILPGADEVCDGVDNDCDGEIDPPSAPDASWYRDADGDGWGGSDTVRSCVSPGSEWTTRGGDCEDGDSDVHPAAIEWCDTIDSDCSGSDEGVATWIDASGTPEDATAWLTSDGVSRYSVMNPGTLKICSGTWAVSLAVRTSVVRIEGVGSGVILSGNDTHQVIRATTLVEELEIENLTLRDGRSSQGGALELSGGTVRLQDVRILDSTATDGQGGGIGIDSDASFILDVSDGEFDGNSPADVASPGWHADVTGPDFSCTAAGCTGDATTVSD